MVNALRAFIADNVKLSSHFLHTHAPDAHLEGAPSDQLKIYFTDAR
jgi:hypothetical protein